MSAPAARARFPRGLSQPAEGGHRFGADALLLACFAHPGRGPVLDLGAGSGAVGLGLGLRGPELALAGLEMDPDMLGHAVENARRLGLEGRFLALRGDVRRMREAVPAESFGQVVCNPPWLRPGRGRTSPDSARERARAETEATLDDFSRAAAWALRPGATAAFIVGAGRLADLLAACSAGGLEPKRLRLVHPKAGAAARFALLEARKQGNPGLTVEPTLVLHGPRGALTPAARAFCPWLRGESGSDKGEADPPPERGD